jgi:hypothetical protein
VPLKKNTVHQITATKKFEEFQEYVKLDDIKPLERFGLVWCGVVTRFTFGASVNVHWKLCGRDTFFTLTLLYQYKKVQS